MNAAIGFHSQLVSSATQSVSSCSSSGARSSSLGCGVGAWETARAISAYRFARDSGVPFARWEFATTPPHAYPDGSTTDAEGGVWNAQWGAGKVVRYATDGQPDIVLDVPVSQPSCVAFGGSRRNLLFVTSARQGLAAGQLEAEPEAGNLLIYKTEFTGVAGYLWRVPDKREATR